MAMPTIPDAIRAGLRMRDALKEAVTIYSEWNGPVTDEAMVFRLAMRLGYGRTPQDAASREYAYTTARAMAGWRAGGRASAPSGCDGYSKAPLALKGIDHESLLLRFR